MTSFIDPQALFEWCRLPVEELENHPQREEDIKVLPCTGYFALPVLATYLIRVIFSPKYGFLFPVNYHAL
jgi:hypothetical protein